MLLIIGRARYTGHDSKDCSESIIDSIDGVGDPATAAPVPAFAF